MVEISTQRLTIIEPLYNEKLIAPEESSETGPMGLCIQILGVNVSDQTLSDLSFWNSNSILIGQ
jgi:hypothetical protein